MPRPGGAGAGTDGGPPDTATRHRRIATGLLIPPYPPAGDVRLTAAIARVAGLDSLFTYDHLQDVHPAALWDARFTWTARRTPAPNALFDYQTLLGSFAPRAGRLQLGVGVTEPVRRHPVLLAQHALTLAHLSRTAPIIGIGSGERMNTAPYGLPLGRAVERLEEALQILRLCFDAGGRFDFAGRHFHLQGAVADLAPPPGRRPRVWVAAHGPRMLALTGRYADGWLPMMLTPDEYRAGLARIRTAAAGAGRGPEAVTPALVAYTAIAPEPRRVAELVGHPLRRYWGLLLPAAAWRDLGAEHPFGPDFRGVVDIVPGQHDRAGLERALALVPPEVIRRAVVVGTPQQVVERLREFGDAGMRHVVIAPLSAMITRRDWYGVTPRALHLIARSLRH